MTEALHAVALTGEDVDTILSLCEPPTLLVGGQALAFWAGFFEVQPTGVLSKSITSDADFIGTTAAAKKIGKALGWKVWVPDRNDMTSQTAKLTKLDSEGGLKQVDFLHSIIGLTTERIQAHAPEVTLPAGSLIRILHPIDVLESRLQNLIQLRQKQNPIGIEQARLALKVVEKYLISLTGAGNDDEKRDLFDSLERVIDMALNKKLAPLAVTHNLDPLTCIPLATISDSNFQTQRWPRVSAQVADYRARYLKRMERTKPSAAK